MMGLAQGMGAYVGSAEMAGSPAALAEQQARWEKERVEQAALAYRGQLTHMALMLLASPVGHAHDAASALKLAHEVIQGAKGYQP